jgi:thiamine-phosphate pyrophosphorylase
MVKLPKLCAICDADASIAVGWGLVDLARAYLNGGARLLQVRAKNAASGWLLDASLAIVAMARTAEAIVIVNDRPDVARLARADGVHLGQEDLAAAAARAIAGANAIVGLSTHTAAELSKAVTAPIDYVAIGPVYDTATKPTGREAVGLAGVTGAAAAARARGLPLVAIGGITLTRAPAVIRAGADSVALIGDLLVGGHPEARVRALVRSLESDSPSSA